MHRFFLPANNAPVGAKLARDGITAVQRLTALSFIASKLCSYSEGVITFNTPVEFKTAFASKLRAYTKTFADT
ncbi:hypothetical protein QF019_003715 [Pseudomonas frederiksbergensis]|uniref:hypothetical protein n=1 Tax=Pseudomonas frederiksbergensis TaxID=104087 RepID=UPI003D24C708